MKKQTKVLATSIATIAMCASLAVGGTFALFTSEDEVNIAVTAGTVKIEATAKNLDKSDLYSGQAAINGGTVSIENMLPGDSITFNVDVTNYSTVPANYRTVLTSEDGGLADALTISFDKATTQAPISFLGGYGVDNWKLLEAAEEGGEVVETITVTIAFNSQGDEIDNLYQGKNCAYKVYVEAVQGNAEVIDPIKKDLDETDVHSDTYYIYSEEGMRLMTGIADSQLASMPNEFYLNFKLMNNLDMTGVPYYPTTRWFINFDGNGKTIENLTAVHNPNDIVKKAGLFGYSANVKNVTLKNMNVAGNQAGLLVGSTDGSTFSNITIEGNNNVTWVDSGLGWMDGGIGALVGVAYRTNFTDITVANGAKITLNYNGLANQLDFANDELGGHFYVLGVPTVLTNISVAANAIVKNGDWAYCIADGLYLMSDNTYKITNANGLVAAGKDYFSLGGTFNLVNSVDMTGKDWVPANIGKNFTFNGNDNTISNLQINQDPAGNTNGMAAYGFILCEQGIADDTTVIKNVVFDKANVTGNSAGNANVAIVLATTRQHYYSTLNMENVTVQNSIVSNGDRSGVFLAYGDSKATITMKNCKSNNNTVSAIGTAGAFIAFTNYAATTIEGFETKNNTVSSEEGEGKAGLVIGTASGTTIVTVADLDAAIAGSTATNAGVATNNFYGRLAGADSTVKINDAWYVVCGDDYNNDYKTTANNYLSKVLSSSDTEINILLGNGNYMNQFTASNKTVYVKGGKGAVVGITASINNGGDDHVGLNGSTFTFDGVSVLFEDGASQAGYEYATKLTYKNCTITGQSYIYGDTDFIGCTFDNDDDAAIGGYRYTYIYAGNVVVDKCIFETKGHALIMYTDNAEDYTLTVRDTTFKADGGRTAGDVFGQNTAGIEISNINGTGSAFKLILEGENKVEGAFSGLWRIKNIHATTGITVVENNISTTYTKADGDVFLDGEAYIKDPTDKTVTKKTA